MYIGDEILPSYMGIILGKFHRDQPAQDTFTQMVVKSKGIPLQNARNNSGLGIIVICPDYFISHELIIPEPEPMRISYI